MKNIKRVVAVGVAGVALCSGLAWRAFAGPNVPAGIAYSGELFNNGTPDGASHTFSFDLLADGTNTPLCTDGPRTVQVTAGRFDIADLFGASCTLDTYLATKTNLQLRITVDSTVLAPNQPFGTVPFAARARVAESAESITAAALPGAGGVGDVVSSLLTLAQFQAQRGTGWVLCDGSALTGTSLGTLSGATTLPDLRGQFLRGFNNGRDAATGDADGDTHALGTAQSDQFASHAHNGASVFSTQFQVAGGAYGYTVAVGGATALPATAETGGNETRPRNVAVNFFCRVN